MTDTRSAEQRRKIMQAVKSTNTGPEMQLRKLLFSQGLRFRLHDKALPGTPDIVFSGRRKAIFVHGCFWHGHDCPKGRLPKSRQDYWSAKVNRNQQRDAANLECLAERGWQALVVWECELRDPAKVLERATKFLSG